MMILNGLAISPAHDVAKIYTTKNSIKQSSKLHNNVLLEDMRQKNMPVNFKKKRLNIVTVVL